MDAETAHRREIRSFVRREGRLTPSQKKALDELWPRYGIDPPGAPLDLDARFGRRASRVLEIGFGNGDHLLARAAAEPEKDFIGCEVHRPGVGRVLNRAGTAGLGNLRVICHDAVEVLRDWLAPGSLAELLVYFPDPWHKKRHHKRRLIQPPFAQLAVRALEPGGRFLLATDWADYARHMREVLDAAPGLRNLAGSAGFMPRPERATTRFETRGLRLGHAVFDLAYERVG